jgi:TonB family protein
LSVHLDASRASDIPFLFEQQQKRMGPAVLVSIGSHVAVALLALLLVRYQSRSVHEAPVLPDIHPNQIIWLTQPGPGGGGGGGGNKMKEPPRAAELPGKDKITVPIQKPQSLEPPKIAKNEPNPVELLNIPAKELAASQDSLPGAIAAPSAPSLSQGSGSGGGAGTGTGTGVGPGTGSGLGPGSGGGTGGGAYRLGSGVTTPQLVREVKPQYTSDAMRAKIQGTVLVECVVNKDGTVGEVQVVRSLDAVFGLDQEAVKAARQWRFRPGTRLGEPVPVLITIQLDFSLR